MFQESTDAPHPPDTTRAVIDKVKISSIVEGPFYYILRPDVQETGRHNLLSAMSGILQRPPDSEDVRNTTLSGMAKRVLAQLTTHEGNTQANRAIGRSVAEAILNTQQDIEVRGKSRKPAYEDPDFESAANELLKLFGKDFVLKPIHPQPPGAGELVHQDDRRPASRPLHSQRRQVSQPAHTAPRNSEIGEREPDLRVFREIVDSAKEIGFETRAIPGTEIALPGFAKIVMPPEFARLYRGSIRDGTTYSTPSGYPLAQVTSRNNALEIILGDDLGKKRQANSIEAEFEGLIGPNDNYFLVRNRMDEIKGYEGYEAVSFLRFLQEYDMNEISETMRGNFQKGVRGSSGPIIFSLALPTDTAQWLEQFIKGKPERFKGFFDLILPGVKEATRNKYGKFDSNGYVIKPSQSVWLVRPGFHENYKDVDIEPSMLFKRRASGAPAFFRSTLTRNAEKVLI